MLESANQINWLHYVWKALVCIGHFLGSIIYFLLISGILVKLGVNIYLAPLLAWMFIILLPKMRRPKINVREGMEILFKDKLRAKAFARTALLIFVFSLLANSNLRLYFWIIAFLNISVAVIIYFRLPRIAQT